MSNSFWSPPEFSSAVDSIDLVHIQHSLSHSLPVDCAAIESGAAFASSAGAHLFLLDFLIECSSASLPLYLSV